MGAFRNNQGLGPTWPEAGKEDCMDTVNGYEIQREAVFENGRGFALGHNPEASPPYGILHFTVMADGQRNFSVSPPTTRCRPRRGSLKVPLHLQRVLSGGAACGGPGARRGVLPLLYPLSP